MGDEIRMVGFEGQDKVFGRHSSKVVVHLTGTAARHDLSNGGRVSSWALLSANNTSKCLGREFEHGDRTTLDLSASYDG